MRRLLAALLATAAGLAALAALAQGNAHQHRFDDAQYWAKSFDDPRRDEWQKPQEVIAALALAPDAVVADIGAGTGYFAVRLARAVPQGRVYGVDIEPDMVKYMAQRAQHEGLGNMTAVQAAADDARLPGKVDIALMVDVYHHISDRERYLAKLAPALKPGGRVAIIDFLHESPVGPPRAARISADQVEAEFRRAGYVLAARHDFLPYQYFLVFTASKP